MNNIIISIIRINITIINKSRISKQIEPTRHFKRHKFEVKQQSKNDCISNNAYFHSDEKIK